MTARRFGQVAVMLGGLLAWAVQFTILYGVTSVSCGLERADQTLLGFRLIPAVIVLTTIAALVVTSGILALSVAQYRQSRVKPGAETDVFLSYSAILIMLVQLPAILLQPPESSPFVGDPSSSRCAGTFSSVASGPCSP